MFVWYNNNTVKGKGTQLKGDVTKWLLCCRYDGGQLQVKFSCNTWRNFLKTFKKPLTNDTKCGIIRMWKGKATHH